VSRPLRVLLLSHFYRPEIGAPQTRLDETARALVRAGLEVRVLTGHPHYPSGIVPPNRRWWLPARESIDGIDVTRLPLIPRPNGGLLDRVIDNGSFAATSSVAVPLVRWSDVVLVESPPLFLGLTAAFHRLASRRPFVLHVADPWPDFPIAMGMLQSPLLRRLALLNEQVAYRAAAAITTVTQPLVDRLDGKPGARGKVRLLPNGVDLARFDPSVDPAVARQRLGWPDARLTVAYVGTVGLAQGVGTLIDAMDRIRGSGVALHIVGGGADQQVIEERVRTEALTDVILHDPIPAAHVPGLLAASDAAVVLLRDGPLYDESLPTKLVEALAAGRPVVVSAAGESARIVRGGKVGLVAAPEDPDALADALLEMRDCSDRREFGARARALAATDFDRETIIERLAGILAAAGGRAGIWAG
jgi:glycosyltransferase involved in cell wall biosynthesis